MTDSSFVFGTDAVAARLNMVEPEQRIMFAAYWAQRLSLAYQRLYDLERFGDPEGVQRCCRSSLEVNDRLDTRMDLARLGP